MLDLLANLSNSHPVGQLDGELCRLITSSNAQLEFGPLGLMTGRRDGFGNPLVLTAHRDQIGLRISHFDEDGFASFVCVGGWDPQILVGQAVVFGDDRVPGVVGRKPIHLLKGDEEKQVVKLENLWIDFGFTGDKEAVSTVPIGTFGVIDRTAQRLHNGRLSGRALDDLVGCAVAVEVLRRAEVTPFKPSLMVALTKHEETIANGVSGNYIANRKPQLIVALDVTFAEDPETLPKDNGNVKLGKGPVIYHGGMLDEEMTQRVVALAVANGINYQEGAIGGHTSTDADGMALGGDGQEVVLISIPVRNMHSPVELAAEQDMEATVRLLVALYDALSTRTLL